MYNVLSVNINILSVHSLKTSNKQFCLNVQVYNRYPHGYLSNAFDKILVGHNKDKKI